MIEFNELTYTAIITFSLPNSEEKTQATIQLQPADNVTIESGEIKRLRDCTLADLQAYADTLEQDVWATYREIQLEDLVNDGELRIEVTLLNEQEGELPAPEALLNHIMVPLTIEQKEKNKETIPVEEIEAPPTVDEPDNNPLSSESDTDTITVAKSEPIYAEREASPDSISKSESTPQDKLRILGRRRPAGHPTQSATDILMNEPAFRDAQAHALSSMSKEVAGMLIGPQPEKQPDGRYVVHVTDIIIAKHTRMQGASVTYTPESWRYINDKLMERYPDGEAVIVGWYHTHPGFGIFLSGMDLFIHQNFFTQIWHIAFVLDPVARKSGFFGWNRAQTQVQHYEFPWPQWAKRSW